MVGVVDVDLRLAKMAGGAVDLSDLLASAREEQSVEAGPVGLCDVELEECTVEEQLWQKKSPAMEVGLDPVPAMAGADAAAGKGGRGVFLWRRIRRGGTGGGSSIPGWLGLWWGLERI
jgi:hypothetical protein